MDANNKQAPPVDTNIPVLQQEENFNNKVGVDTTWTNNWVIPIGPESDPDKDSIKFNAPKLSNGNYYFLQEAKINITAQIVDKDGNAPLDTTAVGVVNSIGTSLFSEIKIFCNDTELNGACSSEFPYFAYVYHLLNYSKEKKEGNLKLQGYIEANAADYSEVRHNVPVASSYLLRRDMFGHYGAGGFKFNNANDITALSIPLMSEFNATKLPIIPNVNIRVRLKRSEPDFYMMLQPWLDSAKRTPAIEDFKAKKYRIKILSAVLNIPVKTMNVSLDLKIEQMLAKKPVEYHTKRMEVTKKHITKGSVIFNTTQLKEETTCPERMFFMIVPDYCLTGNEGQDPFYLSDLIRTDGGTKYEQARSSVVESKLCVNNVSLETQDTGTAEETLWRKYQELDNVMGNKTNSNSSLSFSVEDYRNIKFIIGYDLTQAKNAALLGPEIRGVNLEGALSFELRFSKGLPCDCWLICMSEYRSLVKIDKNRSVMCQYLA